MIESTRKSAWVAPQLEEMGMAETALIKPDNPAENASTKNPQGPNFS